MTREKLTLLLDEDDLRTVERECPEALQGTVVAMDVEVYLALLDAGFSPITPWDVVHPDDKPDLDAWHDGILRVWSAHARIDYNGIDLLSMARFRHLACLARMAWVSFVIHRCLTRYQPSEVVTFEERSGHGLEQPAHHRKMPVLFAIVHGMAEQAGVAVRSISRSRDDADCAFIDHAAASGSRSLASIDWDTVMGEAPYVLFAGSGIDLLRQLPLIEALECRDDCKVVQVYKSAEESILRNMRRAGHEILHESQLPEADEGSFDPSSFTDARERLLRSSGVGDVATTAIYGNEYLRIHFEFIFGEYARRMAVHVDRFGGFLRRFPPGLIVANHPDPIVEVASRMGIATILLPHGVISTLDERWYGSLPRVNIGAVGEVQRTFLKSIGVSQEHIVLTGDPALEEMVGANRVAGPSSSRAGRPSSDHTRGDDRLRILFATGPLGRVSHAAELPTVDWKLAIQTVREIAELAKRRTDWQWIVKPHPRYDHRTLYERIFDETTLRDSIIVTDDRTLSDCLAGADVVVFANTRSSGIVEASFVGCPVVILNTSMRWLNLAKWRLDRWPVVETVAALETELDCLARSISVDHRSSPADSDVSLSRQGMQPVPPEAGGATDESSAPNDHYTRRVRQTEAAARAFFGERPKSSLEACTHYIRHTAGCLTGS